MYIKTNTSASMSSKTHSKDGLKNHGGLQKKSLSLEEKRFSDILKNCISQLETAATLPAAVIRLNSVSSAVDKELSEALQQHQILSARLESDGDQEGDLGKARTLLERDFKDSVRNVLRIVRARPDAMLAFMEESGMEVGQSERLLIKNLKDLHSRALQRMLTSQEEKSEKPDSLETLVSWTEDEQSATAITQLDTEISTKNDNLQNLNRSREDDNQARQQERQSFMKVAKVKQTTMQQEIDQLNIQLYNLRLKNKQAEREIREKTKKVETETEYLLQTFDSELEEIQANLELDTAEYERQQEEQQTLQEPFSVLEVEYNQIQEKRRLAEEKRREEMRDLELKTKAAVFAQAWWRGYSTRKALNNKSKSKKPKEGKGKKPKKGKDKKSS